MLKNLISSAASKVGGSDFMKRINNAAFKDGLCAGCALVAAASGDVGAEEKLKFGKFMDTHPDLKSFDGAEMSALFKSYCDLAEVSPIRLWKVIDKVPQDQRQDVLEMVARMAAADGNVDEKEEKIIVKLCERWGFDKSDYVE